MMAAMEKTKNGLRDQLVKQLPQIEEFESVTGKTTWKEGMAVRPLFVVRLAEGKPHLVETTTGDER